jgi:hypothetical protein
VDVLHFEEIASYAIAIDSLMVAMACRKNPISHEQNINSESKFGYTILMSFSKRPAFNSSLQQVSPCYSDSFGENIREL